MVSRGGGGDGRGGGGRRRWSLVSWRAAGRGARNVQKQRAGRPHTSRRRRRREGRRTDIGHGPAAAGHRASDIGHRSSVIGHRVSDIGLAHRTQRCARRPCATMADANADADGPRRGRSHAGLIECVNRHPHPHPHPHPEPQPRPGHEPVGRLLGGVHGHRIVVSHQPAAPVSHQHWIAWAVRTVTKRSRVTDDQTSLASAIAIRHQLRTSRDAAAAGAPPAGRSRDVVPQQTAAGLQCPRLSPRTVDWDARQLSRPSRHMSSAQSPNPAPSTENREP